jgi:hypothetical protein
MANRFDPANAPTREPDTIQCGTLVQWRRPDLVGEYPPADYRLIYTAVNPVTQAKFAVTSTVNAAGEHAFFITGAVTATIPVGEYHWQVEVERISDQARIPLYSGTVTVSPSFAQAGIDPRTHAERMLAKIESILEGRADKDVSSYSINGRSITKMSIDELLKFRAIYRAEVQRLRDAEAVRQGRASKSLIKTRFV